MMYAAPMALPLRSSSPRTLAMLARPISRSPRMMAAAAAEAEELRTEHAVEAVVKATQLQLAMKKLRAVNA